MKSEGERRRGGGGREAWGGGRDGVWRVTEETAVSARVAFVLVDLWVPTAI